mmetsp:Transcript_29126/g.84668  ORF Transcript_29126/g.84668 Transcript_29126/m.84668 type:complete len:95 (-) Transcript_29126:3438-3722(-)
MVIKFSGTETPTTSPTIASIYPMTSTCLDHSLTHKRYITYVLHYIPKGFSTRPRSAPRKKAAALTASSWTIASSDRDADLLAAPPNFLLPPLEM